MKQLQCDVLVIGGGGSGLISGCRAATLGKSVIVLEKDKNLGGGMNMASTMRTFGSKWQKERNLPDTTALYMRNRMDETFWRLDRKLAKNAIQGTGKFFDWFCDLAPEEIPQFRVGRYVFDDESDGPLGPQSGGHGPGMGKGSGRVFVETCAAKLREMGGTIFTETITDEILMENGAVRGAKAHNADGDMEISCKKLILACGAWIRNPEFVAKHYPKLADAIPFMGESPHMNRMYTGDGLRLAAAVGAKMDTTNLTIRMMGPMTMCRSRVMSDMANSAYSIYVNKNGERFVCEGSQLRMGVFNSGSVQVEQPDGMAYVIFDQKALRSTIENPDIHPKPQMAMPFGQSSFPATMEEAMADITPALENGGDTLFVADSLEELAAKLSIPAEKLQETVAAYNEAAETGMDWDCYKPAEWLQPMDEAPYYAVKASLGTDGAFGGVEINENMQVKAEDGSIIPGLYATGDLCSGRFVNMAGIKMQYLNDMSFAVSSGYLAGTHAGEN